MKTAFFDVDGTLTTTHVWRGLMAYFQTRKYRRMIHFLFMAYHAPQIYLRKKGIISETSFRSNWAKHLAWYVRGYSTAQAETIWGWITTSYLNQYWRKDVINLLKNHLANGDLVILVSAGPQPLIKRIARELGTEHAIGTRFEISNNIFTGRSHQPVCIDQYKASLAQEYLKQHKISVDLDRSFAYADSITDLPLLEMVGNPIPTYPDDDLKITARLRKWKVFPFNTLSGE